jgi:hypothetical protein
MIAASDEIVATGDHLGTRSLRMRVIVGCLLAYAILAVAVFWPILPWSPTRLPSGSAGGYGLGDAQQMTWFLEWVPYALRHGLDVFHTNFLDYPQGVNLASNTLSPLLGLLAAPVTLTLGPVAAFNVLLRLAFAASAGSMFLVLRTWCRWPMAFVGGLVYGFGPYMAVQGQAHLNLVFVPLPPVIVWCFYELLVTRRRSPVRVGLLLGALAGAQALIEPELLVLVAIVVAVGLVGIAIVSRNDLRQQFEHLARATIPAAAVFLVIAGYLLWSTLLAPGHLVGPVLPVGILQGFGADFLGPIIPTAAQLIAPHSLAVDAMRFVGGNTSENTSYLGLPIVALVSAFAIMWRRERIVLAAALLALVAFILSLGSSLSIDGHWTRILMPEDLFRHLPVLDNIVPTRFSFVVVLFTVIALAVGGDRFFHAEANRRPHRWSGRTEKTAGVIALVMAVALVLPRVPFMTQPQAWPHDTESTLNIIPPGSVVLSYPFTDGVGTPTRMYTQAMSWQAADGMRFRLIGGYATIRGAAGKSQQDPLLLAPGFVQEYLVRAQYGRSVSYPAPHASVNPERALCRFLSNYGVGAVVFWDAGAHPNEVKQLFSKALGTPTRTTHDDKVLVWLTGPGRCDS